jgi:hypothetical protein
MEIICHNARARIQEGNIDMWSYIWANNTLTTKNAYNTMIGYHVVHPHFSWLWDSSSQLKHKFFFWLLLHDRLNTGNLMRRKNFQLQSYACVTAQCSQEEETLVHLFWTCPFAVK